MVKTRVLLLQESLMLYRLPCWNILSEYYDFTIGYFGKDQTKDSNCSFKKKFFKSRHFGPFEIVRGVRSLANSFDVVIVMPDLHIPSYSLLPFLPHKYKLLTWGIGFRVSYSHPYLTRRPHKFLDKIFEMILRRCDANIFYMEKSKEFWENTKVDLNKIYAAPNTTSVQSVNIGNKDKRNFIFVGTLYKGKGVDILIKSFAEAKKIAKSDSQLDIIGAGEMLDELKCLAVEKGISSDVNFIGPVYDESVLATYFQKALLCISPTQGGLTCPKSMGYGVPFVTRKDSITGGEIYHMTPDTNGIMYDNDCDLTNILVDALQHKEKYINMGIAAKEYYDKNATPEHMAKGVVDAITYTMEEKMKILYINVAQNWGSTGRIVEGIGTLAASQGWEVFVAHGARYVMPSVHKSIQISSKFVEYLHFIESALFDAQGKGSRIATKKFLKVLDEIKPDLIHIHNLHGCYINYPMLFRYLKCSRIPVVWTFHDCWPITGHCVYFEKIKCKKWQKECCNCPQEREYPVSYFLDRSLRNYKLKKKLFTSIDNLQVTTVSSWLKDVVKNSFLCEKTVTNIPNGINKEVYKSYPEKIKESLSIVGKKMVLAVAAGFGERKGIRDYAELSKLLPPHYCLVMLGAIDSDLQVLPSNVITIKNTSNIIDLCKYYSAADVLLSLSYEETFGMTILEAMACGTPVIAYNNTAQPELITYKTGIIVETGDIYGVMNAIVKVCSKGKVNYSMACRERALEYDEEKIYRKYLNLYVQTIKK